jgi:hypothetical protein
VFPLPFSAIAVNQALESRLTGIATQNWKRLANARQCGLEGLAQDPRIVSSLASLI